MSRSSVSTRKTGRVTVARTGPRPVLKSSAKPQIVENPREKLLIEVGIDPQLVSEFSTQNIIDLLYIIQHAGYDKEAILASLAEQVNDLTRVFPYESLLDDQRNEYEFVLNYTPQPIEARDCKKCGQKGTVTFEAFTYHRADEAGTSTFRCTQCKTVQ